MTNAIETMMAEHRLIVRVLGGLHTLASRLRQGQPVPREDVARFARFFREFADRAHHAKEEDRLFGKLIESGFSPQYGPVAVMLAEHTAGRQHVRALAQAGEGCGPLTPDETAQVIHHAEQFVPLLMDHIRKEDHILYPMAQEALSAKQLANLDAECDAFDRQIQDSGQLQQLKDLAAELIRAYPADPARFGAAD